jgi:zinc transporter ZupT
MMIMVGDTFHNFVDGILIAAAFLADKQLGLVTSIAIIAHEVPQEVGDFLVLLHSGYTKRYAFVLNVLSSLAMMVGGVLAYFALQTMQQWIPSLLALAAASMIYVSVADLIPGLHRRPEIRDTLEQAILIAAASPRSGSRHAHTLQANRGWLDTFACAPQNHSFHHAQHLRHFLIHGLAAHQHRRSTTA